MRFLLLFAAALGGCGLPVTELLPPQRQQPVVEGRIRCEDGAARARADLGDEALCTVPRVSCNPATDLLLIGQCHYAPGAIAASACCDPQPAGCSQSDCTCLLHNGNFLDYQLAAEEGIDFPEYRGPKRICSYRFSCTPATDGGLATISCTPA